MKCECEPVKNSCTRRTIFFVVIQSKFSTFSVAVVRTENGGGGFCDKNPLIVQDYLGYKSTKDPLFKADSLMLKAVPLVNESVVDEAD